MDRFKFRVWDILLKEWIPFDEDTKKYLYMDYSGLDIEECHLSMEDFLYLPIDPDNENRFRIMQSTGLKDKNGKLIFEGDVVKIEDLWDWDSCNYLVKYNPGGFFPFFNGDCGVEGDDVEMIGNIYENSELLDELNSESQK